MAAIVNLLAKEKGDAFAKQAIVFADTPTHRHRHTHTYWDPLSLKNKTSRLHGAFNKVHVTNKLPMNTK